MSNLIKFENEDAFTPSEPIDVTKVASAYYTTEEIDKVMERIPDSARESFKDHIFQASFWKHIEHKHVPFDFLKKRKGQKDKDTGEHKMLEYFPADYTYSELNRLFPGWWQEEMRIEVDYKLKTVRCSGYLCIDYPTLSGTNRVVKRYACASTAIKLTKDEDEKTGMFEASQPDDLEKAAITEWIKIAGKQYGIGLEIYSQRITQEMRQMLEDMIKDWGVYASEVRKIAATIETGTGFRDFVRSLPSLSQTERFISAIRFVPETATYGDTTVRDYAWKSFVKLRNDSEQNKLNLEGFIQNMEAAAEKIRTEQKEKQNEHI